jgi:hypothetical protein
VRRFRITAVAAAALCAATATLGAAPAQAGARSDGLWFCRPWGSGPNPNEVCIDAELNGYNAKFINGSNQNLVVDFSLLSSAGVSLPDQGAFPAASGSTHTYFFTTKSLGCARVHVTDQKAPYWVEYSQSDSPGGNCGY